MSTYFFKDFFKISDGLFFLARLRNLKDGKTGLNSQIAYKNIFQENNLSLLF